MNAIKRVNCTKAYFTCFSLRINPLSLSLSLARSHCLLLSLSRPTLLLRPEFVIFNDCEKNALVITWLAQEKKT